MGNLELDAGLESVPKQRMGPSAITGVIGISMADPADRRLVERVATALGLTPAALGEYALELDSLTGFELIVADKPSALKIQVLFAKREEKIEGVNPTLIAACRPRLDPSCELHETEQGFGGVLIFPQEEAQVSAYLNAMLYAHRAFARRFQSALDELHLHRSIFRSVTSGISLATVGVPDLPLTYVNPAFETITGYSLEEVQGNNCRFLQAGEHAQPELIRVREAIKAQRQVVVTLKNYRKDGTFFWNEISLSPIRNRDGDLTHFVGIQNDVTARVEFEAALRQSEKLAAVGRLAATIAHEINNPLESVTNLIYLAQQAEGVPEIREYLRQADQELVQASLITSQSLRFSRQSTKPRAIRPAEILEFLLNLYQGKLDNAGVSVERRERMAGSIVCLESEIRQVLNNLIRNALDAVKGRGGRLLVRSREGTDWRSGIKGVIITVADTGSGISPETMKHLYTPFFTTKGISGTGLGLWVSSEIIKRHHGHLRVRSNQTGRASWTVFTLFLPYRASTVNASFTPHAAEPALSPHPERSEAPVDLSDEQVLHLLE